MDCSGAGAGDGPRVWILLALLAATALATPLPAYVSYAPSMGHGCAFAAASMLLWCSVWCGEAPAAGRWWLCGLALGLAFTTRWQDALLVVLPLVLAFTRWRN